LRVDQSLADRLLEDIKEAVRARINEEALERLVMEKLSEKFDEFVKRARGVENEC
jgi:23S rRNA maturation mini-RNase III